MKLVELMNILQFFFNGSSMELRFSIEGVDDVFEIVDVTSDNEKVATIELSRMQGEDT